MEKIKREPELLVQSGTLAVLDGKMLPLEAGVRPLAHRLLSVRLMLVVKKALPVGMIANVVAGIELLVEPSATLGRGPEPLSPTIITNKVHKWLPGETSIATPKN